jgi:hypothetical protein
MKTEEIIDLVSHISALMEQPFSVSQKGIYGWDWINKKGEFDGELILHTEEREIRFVDTVLDNKTYWAILGLASSFDLTTGDYTSK